MAAREGGHTERTRESYRSSELVAVVVKAVQQLSPTVKGFLLHVSQHEQLSFRAGQWVDVHIPSLQQVGGFSITSDPNSFHEERTFGLAIQFSEDTAAHWMHTQCRVGSQLKVRVGGDFWSEPPPEELPDLLLVAGGIGVNPLYSILKHHMHLISMAGQSVHICLLYSARTEAELLFKAELEELSSAWVDVKFFVTRQHTCSNTKNCRMTAADLREALKTLNRPQCYICGPPPLISYTVDSLRSLAIAEQYIHYEKWW